MRDHHNTETRMNIEREKSHIHDVKNEIPEFTQDEVQTAIDRLKKKVKQVTMELELETSRHATKRQKR